MANYRLVCDVVLGAGKSGLPLGYRIVNASGMVIVAFTTTDVFETNTPGTYTVNNGISIPSGTQGRIIWGTVGNIDYAESPINPIEVDPLYIAYILDKDEGGDASSEDKDEHHHNRPKPRPHHRELSSSLHSKSNSLSGAGSLNSSSIDEGQSLDIQMGMVRKPHGSLKHRGNSSNSGSKRGSFSGHAFLYTGMGNSRNSSSSGNSSGVSSSLFDDKKEDKKEDKEENGSNNSSGISADSSLGSDSNSSGESGSGSSGSLSHSSGDGNSLGGDDRAPDINQHMHHKTVLPNDDPVISRKVEEDIKKKKRMKKKMSKKKMKMRMMKMAKMMRKMKQMMKMMMAMKTPKPMPMPVPKPNPMPHPTPMPKPMSPQHSSSSVHSSSSSATNSSSGRALIAKDKQSGVIEKLKENIANREKSGEKSPALQDAKELLVYLQSKKSATDEQEKPNNAKSLSWWWPTPPDIIDKMFKMANLKEGETVYDLGCGDGRIVVRAAAKWKCKGIGVDIDENLIKQAKNRSVKMGVSDKVDIRHEDALKVNDLNQADVVALYVLDRGLRLLKPILQQKLKPGTRIVCHNYKFKDWKPVKQSVVKDKEGHKHWIYLYTV